MSADSNYVVAEVLDHLIDDALLGLRENPELYTELGGLSWLEERQEFAFGMISTCAPNFVSFTPDDEL